MTLCKAHSKRPPHEPCKNPATAGGVCRFHGAKAPQTILKQAVDLEHERQRLLGLVPDSITVMGELMHADDESVALRAAMAVQDRGLGKVTDKLKISGDGDAPLEIIVSRPASSPSADQTSST